MTKLPGPQRRAQIISIGVDIANRDGLVHAVPKSIASAAKCSDTGVRYHFKKHADLWREIVNHPNASEAVKDQGAQFGLR